MTLRILVFTLSCPQLFYSLNKKLNYIMYLFLVLIGFFFRVSISLLYPNNVWHWRVLTQGLLNDIYAAAIFYLVFRIAWFFIRNIKIRQVIFGICIVLLISLNFINHEYATEYNALVPLSWFYNEVNNLGTIDTTTEILSTLTTSSFIINVILPTLISLFLIIFIPRRILNSKGIKTFVMVFLIGSMAQSATLQPDLQPKRHAIVQSHMFKYWYYSRDASPLQKRRTKPLPEFSDFFKKIVIEESNNKNGILPIVDTHTNVVLIILESFRAHDIGTFGSKLGISKNFDKYASKGILFDNVYSGSHKTQRGLWSILCGAHPRNGASAITDYPDHGVSCITDIVAKHDYESFWFYGQSGAFDSFGYFMESHNVNHIMDRLTFPNEAKIVGAGIGDEDVMKHAIKSLDSADKPFFAIIQTLTNHHPHFVPPEFDVIKEFSSHINNGYNTFLYTDYALGLFLDTFLKTPEGKNSLVIITADHGTGKKIRDRRSEIKSETFLKYRIPLLFLYPDKYKVKPQRVSTLGSQPDIMPTILDIMNIQSSIPNFGRSFARNYKNRYAKGQSEGHWIISENKVFYLRPSMQTQTYGGKVLPTTKMGKNWMTLIAEIDDVQDWMIQEKDSGKVYRTLDKRGWR